MMRKIPLTYLAIGLIWASIAYCGQVLAAPQGVPKHIIFKGLNTKAGPLSLDDGESPDCLNVHTNIFGTLVRRNGFTKLNNATHAHITTSPGVVNGLYDYFVTSAITKLIGYYDNKLYKMDGLDGIFDPIKFATAMTDDTMEFENFDGTLIMETWSRDLGQSWNGTASATSDITNMPKGKHILRAYNRMFVLNIANYELRFYFSNAGSYTTYTTASDYETLDAPSGDSGMGWGLLKGRLFGFSKYTVSLISDVGGSDPIQVSKRIDGTGCSAGKTIKTIHHPISGESLVWLTQDKRLVMWNGSSLLDIADKVYTNNDQCPVYMQRINASSIEKAHSQVYENKGWYVLWIPISTNVDYGVIFDYKTNTLWPLNNQDFNSSATVKTTSGNLIYVGTRTGDVYRWDYGASDDGSFINSYWASRKWDFGFAPYLKKMGEVQITLKGIGDYDLNYQNRYGWSDSWTTAETLNMKASDWVLGDALPAILGGKIAKTHRFTIPASFNLFQIKFSTNNINPAWEIFSLDLITQILSVND